MAKRTTMRSLEAHGSYDVILILGVSAEASWDCVNRPSFPRIGRKYNMEERPFSVAFLFGIIWVILAFLGGLVVLPVWSNLNIGLCCLAICVCILNYLNEYLGKFPLSYR